MTDRKALSLPSADEGLDAASEWLSQLDRAGEALDENADIDAIAARHSAFGAWLSETPTHRVAFLRMLRAWGRSDRLRALDAPARPEALQGSPLSGARSRVWAWGGIAASIAAALLAVPAVMLVRDGRPPTPEYMTEVGGREVVPLSDGSRVELNSDTHLTAALGDDLRIVTIARGEAYFDVAHDPDRPFQVIAGDQSVTVLGTSFSVHKRDAGIEVAVTEGRVRIDADTIRGEAPAFLEAGDIAVAEEGALLIASNEPEDVTRELSWRQGLVVFDKATLAQAAAEFNRYNRVQVVIDDPKAADIRLSGRFETDNVDAFIRLISEGFALTATRRGDRIFITE